MYGRTSLEMGRQTFALYKMPRRVNLQWVLWSDQGLVSNLAVFRTWTFSVTKVFQMSDRL